MSVADNHHHTLKVRATATSWTCADWAEGIDAEQALINLANKLGIDRRAMLGAFGVTA